MDTLTYVKQIFKDHLLTSAYKQLSSLEAKNSMEAIKATLSKLEWVYFQRSLSLHHRLPIFYGLPKVHKTPVSLSPVVSGTNSLLATFYLLIHIKSFIKDSATIIRDLKDLNLPKEARLFTADATVMYTNIDMKLGINSIHEFLTDQVNNLPPKLPNRPCVTNPNYCDGRQYFQLCRHFLAAAHRYGNGHTSCLHLCHDLFWTI
jgi:hypothetical protein